MMNQVPTKIVLKSTTRMSLNDRFSNIAPSTQMIRANVMAEHQVSAANRRLAQQMANRPGIPQNQVAAMYNRQPGRMRRGSMQQRLGGPGGNVKARLTLPNQQFQPRGRGRGMRGRGGNIPQLMPRGGMQQQWSPNKTRGRGGFAMRSPRGQTFMRGQGRGQFNRLTGQSNNTNNFTPRGRGGRGGRANRRGGRGFRGGRGRGGKPQTSVSDLDNQLDAYMSKTKSALDAELDVYMSGTS